MLENKVNAGFQPNQAERYKQRGVNYVKQGKITGFATVLIAPEIYFSGDTKGFDHRINYETLMNWFENSDIRAGRKKYKTYLLKSAIEKSSIGYQMVEDAVVSVFWRDYWLLVSNIAPEFCMAEPAKKPAGSWFIYFNQVGLPKNVKLVHKLVNGCFDIQFNGMGDRVSEIILMYKDKLLPNMQIVKAAKSASIRVKVPELTAADSLEVQKEKAIEAIHSGKKLLEWYKTISI